MSKSGVHLPEMRRKFNAMLQRRNGPGITGPKPSKSPQEVSLIEQYLMASGDNMSKQSLDITRGREASQDRWTFHVFKKHGVGNVDKSVKGDGTRASYYRGGVHGTLKGGSFTIEFPGRMSSHLHTSGNDPHKRSAIKRQALMNVQHANWLLGVDNSDPDRFIEPLPTVEEEKDRNRALEMKVNAEIIFHKREKFSELMAMDGITPEEVVESLSIQLNRDNCFTAGEGVGQSGSFFFHTYDGRFIIKTLRGRERNNILDMVDDMIAYFKDEGNKNRSLLARIYGVFTIKTNHYASMDVILMQHTVRLQSKFNPTILFDLKGSTKGRMAPQKDRFWRREMNSRGVVLKDLNYLEINKDLGGRLMQLNKEQVKDIDSRIKQDAAFLAEHNLMDYSVLLAIEEIEEDADTEREYNNPQGGYEETGRDHGNRSDSSANYQPSQYTTSCPIFERAEKRNKFESSYMS